MTVTEIGKEIKVNYEEVITVNEIMKLKKEMARIKEENEILKKAMLYLHIQKDGITEKEYVLL